MSISSVAFGAVVHLSTSLADLAGAATDATVALKVRTPDGVETDESASVVHDSTGAYHCDYGPTTQVGEYFYRWTASGTLTAVDEGQFQVLQSEF